jgi:hypothetical protein
MPLHLVGENHLLVDDIVVARSEGAMIRGVGVDGPFHQYRDSALRHAQNRTAPSKTGVASERVPSDMIPEYMCSCGDVHSSVLVVREVDAEIVVDRSVALGSSPHKARGRAWARRPVPATFRVHSADPQTHQRL